MEWMILPFKRYADFTGRSRRREFWMFQLLNLIVGAVLIGPLLVSAITASVAAGNGPGAEEAVAEAISAGGLGLSTIGVVIYGLYAIASFIPGIAVAVRRLHDRDMSGWWYLGLIVASVIPLVGLAASIALFVLMVLPGTDGPNRFGPDPKNPFGEDVFA
jgi:uncharacterized membrane protein YhaH (DUF805 family)